MIITCSFRYCGAVLFIAAVICFFGCKQPERKVLKPVDKATLLNMVKLLAQKENQKNSTQDDGVKLLRSYSDNYELTIIEKDTRAANTAWVQVKVSREKDFRYFDIDVPARLSRQLGYHDFDRAYGPGVETPRPKEPLDFNTMYHAPGADKVTIIVTSEQPPQTTKPGIYRITVML